MRKLTKISTLLAAFSSIAAFSLSTACAQNDRFYIKGDLGGNLTPDIDLKEFFGPVAPGSKIKLDPGVRAGVGAGYQVTDWFAGEVELGVYDNNVDSITDATRVHDASIANVPLLFNAKFQYPNNSPLTPYIGAGLGFSETIFDVGNVTINGTTLNGSDSDAVFAYQAFAGLRYRLNERMGLSLEYRYFVAESPTWHADFSFGTASDTLRFGRMQTHALSLAFEWRF